MNAMTSIEVPSAMLAPEIKSKAQQGAGIVEVKEADGRRSYVVIRDDVYRRLMGPTLLEMVSAPQGDDLDFEVPELGDMGFKPVGLE